MSPICAPNLAKEGAQLLGVSPGTARRLMRDGVLAAKKVGPKLWRTTRVHLERLVQRGLQAAVTVLSVRKTR